MVSRFHSAPPTPPLGQLRLRPPPSEPPHSAASRAVPLRSPMGEEPLAAAPAKTPSRPMAPPRGNLTAPSGAETGVPSNLQHGTAADEANSFLRSLVQVDAHR